MKRSHPGRYALFNEGKQIREKKVAVTYTKYINWYDKQANIMKLQ